MKLRLPLIFRNVGFIVFHLFLLTSLEGSHALEHLVPVDEIAVEFRSVYADKACLATYGESAGSAHSCAVDHDSVQRDGVGNIVFPCHQRSELHHHWWSYGYNTVDVLALYHLFHSHGNDAFLPI